MALKKITTSKVYFCCYFRSDELKSHFRRCDVVVVINSKAIFDVLKKITSRSSEIRRSDPLPLHIADKVQLRQVGLLLVLFKLHLPNSNSMLN
jgi:hypothetical protein